MDRSKYGQPSDPYLELMLKDEGQGCGYLYVGKQVTNDIAKGESIHKCPNCKASTVIKNVRKWRSTGAGLICDVCANTKPNCIVADDNYEVLKVKSDYRVVLPKRLKNFKSSCRNEQTKKVDEDIEWMNNKLESEPDNAWLYVHRAALVAKKYYGEEYQKHVWMSDLEKAISLEPDNAMIYAWCSYLATTKNECIQSLQKVLDIDPNYEPAYIYLAHAYVQDDIIKCQSILSKALEKFPDSKRVRELYERYR
jgi:hypothetical protein